MDAVLLVEPQGPEARERFGESKSVELTIAIAQHLSRTGNLIQIYSDPSLFEARKGR